MLSTSYCTAHARWRTGMRKCGHTKGSGEVAQMIHQNDFECKYAYGPVVDYYINTAIQSEHQQCILLKLDYMNTKDAKLTNYNVMIPIYIYHKYPYSKTTAGYQYYKNKFKITHKIQNITCHIWKNRLTPDKILHWIKNILYTSDALVSKCS